MSRTPSALLALRLAPAGVLLVYRLPGDLQRVGYLLPGPALVPGAVDVQPLQFLQQPAQRHHGGQPDRRIPVGQPAREHRRVPGARTLVSVHACQATLTDLALSGLPDSA